MTPDAPPPPIEILMVDDDHGDIRIAREALKDSKVRHNFHVAFDGEEALQFLRREGDFAAAPRPDMVLMDLNMPRMDGHEALSKIRADPALTDLVVVILTASDREEDSKTAYTLHANAVVPKPVTLDRFLGVVRMLEGFWFEVVRLPAAAPYD